MKRAGIVLLREFLVTQLNYWILFPGVFTLLGLCAGVETVFPAGLSFLLPLSLVPFLLYFCRVRLKNPVLFAATHILVLAAPALIPFHGMIRLVCWGLAAGFTGYSIFLRLHEGSWEDKGLPPLFAVIFAGICLFMLQYYHCDQWRNVLYASVIWAIALFFVISYIESYLNFLMVNEGSASHIPEREIFRSGMRLTIEYTLCGSLVLMATADITWFKSLLNLISYGLRSILAFVFQFISSDQSEYPIASEKETAPAAAPGIPDAKAESFWLWDVLGYIIFAVVVIALLVAAYKGLKFLVRQMRENWGKTQQSAGEDGTFAAKDVREQMVSVRQKNKRRKSLWGFLSVNEQIRRLYRKRAVQLESDADKLRRMTARECADRIQAPEIARIYEKARYSGQECSQTDLKEMKMYVR
jgi:hypothetical protein